MSGTSLGGPGASRLYLQADRGLSWRLLDVRSCDALQLVGYGGGVSVEVDVDVDTFAQVTVVGLVDQCCCCLDLG
jgi:hypothetical protein